MITINRRIFNMAENTQPAKHPCNPESWVENYGDSLYRYTLVRVNKPEEAEDLVQETFFAALKNKNSFRGDSSEKTWLFNILKNKIIDHYRKNKNKPLTASELSASETEEGDGFMERLFKNQGFMEGHWNADNRPGKWGQNLNDALENNEFLTILKACIKHLPQMASAVFRMKYFMEEDSRFICKELDITPSNLWVLAHRSKLQIRECLEKNWMDK